MLIKQSYVPWNPRISLLDSSVRLYAGTREHVLGRTTNIGRRARYPFGAIAFATVISAIRWCRLTAAATNLCP